MQFYTQNKNQTSPHAPKTFVSEHNSNPNPAFPLRPSAQAPASRKARGERAGHTTQPLFMHPASLRAIPPASITPLHLLGCHLVPEFVSTQSRRPAQTNWSVSDDWQHSPQVRNNSRTQHAFDVCQVTRPDLTASLATVSNDATAPTQLGGSNKLGRAGKASGPPQHHLSSECPLHSSEMLFGHGQVRYHKKREIPIAERFTFLFQQEGEC